LVLIFAWNADMTLSINLTRRIRRRKLKDGSVVEQVRFVLNWRDPRTGAREQRFFERQRDAQEKRAELIAAYDRGAYSSSNRSVTVADAVASWLETKRGMVRPITFASYEFEIGYIVGPLLPSEARRAIVRSGVGARPKAKPIELLGRVKIQELTPRRIRAWHKLVSEEVSVYSANKALIKLKAALALAAEDHEFRPPAMPGGLQRQRDKARRAVLTPDEVARLLAAARQDLDKGVYYAAPFLMGTRPSEQLGLMWDDVDFEANVIRIRRIQLRYGTLSEFTKTAAGVREIPMSPLLREMMLAWRVRCPRRDGQLERVFPAPGARRAWPLPREGGGGPLVYGSFRARYWAPALERLGLPAVTPHSARHSFISTLQAQGIEVGLVAKLAGHKSAVVTLSHYTHAMRGGEDAVKALDRAYAGSES
jgi:integrase